MHGDEEDDLLIEEPEDGSFGREDLRQALHASLLDLGLPIPDVPLPSMHDLLSAPPAPIPCDNVQLPSMFLEGDSSPPPVLPSTPVPKSTAKHPRITQQMDPIWATDLRARARQEADNKRVEERRKEMEREARQRFVLHWFDADNAAVKVEWVSKCPYYPQWQLADDPELVASLGTDIHKIEVYDEHFRRWIPTALTHTISLESGCHLFLRRYGVIQCDGFQELLTASKHTSRPRHLRFNMTGERDIVRTKLKAKREIIEIPSSPVITVKREREESCELAFTPMRPRLDVEDFNSRYTTSMSPTPSPLLIRSGSPPRDTFSMSYSSSTSSVLSVASSHPTTAPTRQQPTTIPTITAIPVPHYDPAKPWQVWPHGMHTIDMVAGFRQMDDKQLRAIHLQHELFPLVFGVPYVKATYHHNRKMWQVTDHAVLAEHEAAGHSSLGLWSHYLDARRKALGQQSKKPGKAR
ncbi:hypothetical protein EDD22DRAFT_848357 [Suillus occidentalis]|nr:hypothetical protein EDD22DRAFT_848357 [Suillus occidentalis]